MSFKKKVNRVVEKKNLVNLTLAELLKDQVVYMPDEVEQPYLFEFKQKTVAINEHTREKGIWVSATLDVKCTNGYAELGDENNRCYKVQVKLFNSALPIYKAIFDFRGLDFPDIKDISELTFQDVDVISDFGILLKDVGYRTYQVNPTPV